MKFTRKQGNYVGSTHYWVGRKNNVTFRITPTADGLWISCNHNKSEAALNTLWLPNNEGLFPTMEKAREFCENFKFQDYKEHCVRYDENNFK